MNVGKIKTILWTNAMEKKHGECVFPPMVLRRDPQMIREFFWSGLTQKRGLCDKYSSFEDDESLRILYDIEDAAVEERRSCPCVGLTMQNKGITEAGRCSERGALLWIQTHRL